MTNFDGKAYQARFDALAQKGVDVHGEATFVRSLNPATVLDAGCGTGRVAIELARHGVEVVGVDVDSSMIAEARGRAPQLTWVLADLVALALGRVFDVVVLAGNVPLFCPIDVRPALVRACAAHVGPGGALVAGFQLDGRYSVAEYDLACEACGLLLTHRWSTWDRVPFSRGGDYVVSVHRQATSS
ncbi:MAG: class I SAM-dependent methyltransferase [Acidimicrobiales bacterium]